MNPLKTFIATLFLVIIGMTVVILFGVYQEKTPEAVPFHQYSDNCDTTCAYDLERIEWAIAEADLIFRSTGIYGVAELIAQATLRYPDSVIYKMRESSARAKRDQHTREIRKATGRVEYNPIKKSPYEDQSAEE